MRKITILLAFLLFAGLQGAFAQKTITGKVTSSDDGQGMVGVSILVKGTSIGTTTDINGAFTLNVPADAVTLVITFIGMKKVEIPIRNQTVFNVVLESDLTSLDEVQVVGYGSIRKSVSTGAISRVPMETIQPVATQRVDQMLQGRAAGVLVLNTDGSPGGNTTIRIRGMNSIQGGNDALIVIDGFQGGSLRTLNPNDIASIEVLKDAAATAIYGAQGANGVILIETKKGKTEKPVINYSSEFGTSKIIMGKIELMGAAEYAREMNRYKMANNYQRVPLPAFTEDQILEFEKTGGTNWMDEVYRRALTQTHQLSVSGKTDVVNYFVSGSILDQEGIMINSGYKRYSLRTNLSAIVTDWASIGVNWDGTQQDKFGATFGSSVDWPANPVFGALNFAPTLPVYDEFGNYSMPSTVYGDGILWNPVASAKEPLNDTQNTQNNLNLYMEFKFLEGLTFRISGGARIGSDVSKQYNNLLTFTGLPALGRGQASNSSSKNLQNSNILTYKRDIGRHHINAVAVGEIKYNNSFNFSINNNSFAVQETGVYNLGSASIKNSSSSYSERKMLSALTRVNYGFENRYTFAASYRADGSSVFGSTNKWSYFPSVSVGWRLTEEEFMKDFEIFNNIMLRASWGKTGNQAISAYQTLAKISSGSNYPWDGGEANNISYSITSASNPNLKWETTAQTNIGLDVSMYRGRLRFTVDYYDKVTSDLLMARELPRSTGLSSIIDNVGSMGNKGWEFSVDGDINIGDLKWTTAASLTASTTTVLDLGTSEFLNYTAGGSGQSTNIPFMFLRVGEPFGQIMGFGYEGTWKLGEEEEAGRYGQMPGDPRYTDVNDDGKIDYDHDFKVIGNATPNFIFGLNNQFNFRKWELSFQFQGTYGNDVFNVARIKRESSTGYSINKLNRWTPDNQDTDIPALIDGISREAYKVAWNAAHPSNPLVSTIIWPTSGSNVTSRWIEDGSYIRLKNITLAYNLPMTRFISNIRVYASSTNLLTFTKYTGFDPEVSSYTNDASLGTDYNNYPPSRIINIGINVTF